MENLKAAGNYHHEKFLARRLALSVDVVRTSGIIKEADFPMLRNPPEITRSKILICNSAQLFQHNWTLPLRMFL